MTEISGLPAVNITLLALNKSFVVFIVINDPGCISTTPSPSLSVPPNAIN